MIRTTLIYRTFLENFLKANAIRSVVDAGCGDWSFSRAIDWREIDYQGFDIVESVIERNKKEFSQPNIAFHTGNFLELDLPAADLLVCKHVLQHLPSRDILRFFGQFSKYKHVLLTNSVGKQSLAGANTDIEAGDFRTLDPTTPPFNLKGSKVLGYSDGYHMHQVVHIEPGKTADMPSVQPRSALVSSSKSPGPDGTTAKEPETGRVLFANSNLRIKVCKHGAMMYYENDAYIGRSLDLYGEFSEREMDLLRQVLCPGMTVVDIGANIGVHTIFFAEIVGPGGTVYAFEPQRTLYHLLCGNIALNRHENIFAVNAGLGSEMGPIVVPGIDYEQGGNLGGISLGKTGRSDEVPMQTLDSYALTSCHVINIDVEGMERFVLEGAAKTLERHKPLLYVANGREANSCDLIEWLLSHEYRLYWHLPAVFNPKNFFSKMENIFGNTISINMLCIPKSVKSDIRGMREITSPNDTWRKPQDSFRPL
jgi:FkbM family methyltransferase